MLRSKAWRLLALSWLSSASLVTTGSQARAPSGPALIVAEDEPRTATLAPGVTLRLAQGTRLTRLPTITLALAEKDTSDRAYVVELASGTLDVEIDTSKPPVHAVLVKAPRRVGAVAKGGHARIVATDKAVTVAAISGRDMISALGDRWRALRVGRAFSVSDSDPAGQYREVPGAPQARLSKSLLIAPEGKTASLVLDWAAVSSAESYRLEVFGDKAKPGVSILSQSFGKGPATFALPPGSYRVQLSARDGWGLETACPRPLPVRVVGVRLPHHALIEQGTIRISRYQKVQLLAVDGLELTYGERGDLFIPAAKTLGLYEDQPLTVRLRDAASGAESRLRLEPLLESARIELSPRRAIWPKDTLEARIVLQGVGDASARSLGLVPEVTVNARPIPVEWTEQAGQLTARVDKPPISGPWVVRVGLRDTQQNLVAEDFLEVAELNPVAHRSR